MAQKYADEDTDKFLERMAVTLNEGYKSLMVAYGLETGLFKTLEELSPTPKTTHEIADAAGLKERYVREWLGGMVASGIVDIESEKYFLPSHRVPAFKEGDLRSHFALFIQGIPVLGKAYDAVLDATKKDGPLGVPYSDYETFPDFVTNFSKSWFNKHLCQTFIKSRAALHEGLEKGYRVLDLGCCHGYAGMNIASHYPNSSVTGLDNDEGAIKVAREIAKEKGLSNIGFVCSDANKMPGEWTDTFDFVFCINVIHGVPRPDLMLGEVRRILKPGGSFSCLDPYLHTKDVDNIKLPHAVPFYSFSLFHCLPVSYQFPGSLGLGCCWGKEACIKLLQENGFTVDAVEMISGGDEMLHYFCNPK